MVSNVGVGHVANSESLKYLKIRNKATSGGSAIAVGAVVKLTEATGAVAITPASADVVGPFGVIPNLYPVNVDADAQTLVMMGGGQVYVRADGAIKPGQRVKCSAATAGQVVAYAGTAVDPSELTVGIYEGHVDEGQGIGNPATDAADNDIIRVSLAGIATTSGGH